MGIDHTSTLILVVHGKHTFSIQTFTIYTFYLSPSYFSVFAFSKSGYLVYSADNDDLFQRHKMNL